MAALCFLYINYEELILEPQVRDDVPREKAGTALRNTNTAKRRYSGSLSYFDLEKGANINIGDTLFTQEQASIDIQLQTGSIIRVNQLSLLIIGKHGNQYKVFLGNGELTGTLAADDQILFNVDEEEIEVFGQKGDQFWISKNKDQPPFLAGLGGKPKVKYKDLEYSLENSKLLVGPKPEKKPFSPNDKKSSSSSADNSPSKIPSKRTSLPSKLKVLLFPSRTYLLTCPLLILPTINSFFCAPKVRSFSCQKANAKAIVKSGSSKIKFHFQNGNSK